MEGTTLISNGLVSMGRIAPVWSKMLFMVDLGCEGAHFTGGFCVVFDDIGRCCQRAGVEEGGLPA